MVGLREKTMCFPYFSLAANPSGSRLGHFFCTGGKENASWGRNASRQYTKTTSWTFSKWIGGKTVPTWARLAPLLGEVGFYAANLALDICLTTC